MEKRKNCKVLGIHIEGSKFSNDTWSKLGQPTKNMSGFFIKNLIQDLSSLPREIFFYIFCSPERKEEIDFLFDSYLYKRYYIIAFDNIWDSLSCVSHCNFVIGMDSCIKTMANMLQIPSVVLVGDYLDSIRDDNFLTPYIRDGHMQIVKFKNIDDIDPKNVLKLINL